jgi:endo-1,4-beta-xylanase
MKRAIRFVKSRAKEWAIDPSKVGVMGFSAGGEVAGLSAMHLIRVMQTIKIQLSE